MNKKALTEADIRTKFIYGGDPRANGGRWDQIQIAGARGKLKAQLKEALNR